MTDPMAEPDETGITPPRLHREIPRIWRRIALVVAVGRYAVSLAGALLFWALLATGNVVLLVLMRPQKEFMLWGGAQGRVVGEPDPIWLLLAFLPLGLLAIPAFFVVGRAYGSRLREGTGPRWLTRTMPPHRLELAQRVLTRWGPVVAFLGRFAALPPTVLAAAAGISDVSWRRYLAADAAGAILAAVATIGIGYWLGRAWGEGRTLLTITGLAMFVLVIALLTYWIRREAQRDDAPSPAPVEGA